MRGPVIVATRGLGDDLMSAEIGALPDLLSERRGGSFEKTLRHLDGEDRTRKEVFDCTVTVTEARIEEYCGAGSHEFINIYDIGKGITEQWLGDAIDTLRVVRLR